MRRRPRRRPVPVRSGRRAGAVVSARGRSPWPPHTPRPPAPFARAFQARDGYPAAVSNPAVQGRAAVRGCYHDVPAPHEAYLVRNAWPRTPCHRHHKAHATHTHTHTHTQTYARTHTHTHTHTHARARAHALTLARIPYMYRAKRSHLALTQVVSPGLPPSCCVGAMGACCRVSTSFPPWFPRSKPTPGTQLRMKHPPPSNLTSL